MVTIAVDAMGGDDAPKAEVEGAIRAARTLGVRVILVGKQDVVRAELDKHEDVDDLLLQFRRQYTAGTLSPANACDRGDSVLFEGLPKCQNGWS